MTQCTRSPLASPPTAAYVLGRKSTLKRVRAILGPKNDARSSLSLGTNLFLTARVIILFIYPPYTFSLIPLNCSAHRMRVITSPPLTIASKINYNAKPPHQ